MDSWLLILDSPDSRFLMPDSSFLIPDWLAAEWPLFWPSHLNWLQSPRKAAVEVDRRTLCILLNTILLIITPRSFSVYLFCFFDAPIAGRSVDLRYRFDGGHCCFIWTCNLSRLMAWSGGIACVRLSLHWGKNISYIAGIISFNSAAGEKSNKLGIHT